MTWIKAVTPKQLNELTGVYKGQWMPEMDRCWIREEDQVMVCSRLLRTKWGNVEHVTITRGLKDNILTIDGSSGFTWAEKQQIKNELFGDNRDAVEVYPKESKLVDTADVYHLWVFDKKFEMPFGIHPKQFKPAVKRGVLKLSQEELMRLKEFYEQD